MGNTFAPICSSFYVENNGKCEQLNPCSGYVVWSITRSLALPSPAFQESVAESCGLFLAALGS